MARWHDGTKASARWGESARILQSTSKNSLIYEIAVISARARKAIGKPECRFSAVLNVFKIVNY